MDGKELDLVVSGYCVARPEVPPLGHYHVRLAVAVPRAPMLSQEADDPRPGAAPAAR